MSRHTSLVSSRLCGGGREPSGRRMPYSGPKSPAGALEADTVEPAGEAPANDEAGEEGEAPVDEKLALSTNKMERRPGPSQPQPAEQGRPRARARGGGRLTWT